MNRLNIQFLLLSLLCLLTWNANADDIVVPQVPTAKPVTATERNITAKLDLTQFSADIAPGTLVSTIKTGLFCSSHIEGRFSDLAVKEFSRQMKIAFDQTMKNLGYQNNKKESDFDTTVETSSNFKVGARLMDAKYNFCVTRTEMKGALYIKVRWELFSEKLQKVVLTTTTEGSMLADSFTLSNEAGTLPYLNAVTNLFANAEFINMLAEANSSGEANPATQPSATTVPSGAGGQPSGAGESAGVPLVVDAGR